MDLADPDLPPGIRVPVLGADAPPGVGHECYRRLCAALDAMPRRSRVVFVLRLPAEGRKRLTLRAIGSLFGVRVARDRRPRLGLVPWRGQGPGLGGESR